MTYGQLAARIREAALTKVGPALAAEMATTMLEAEGLAKGRLGGQVLNPRTGNLRRSLASFVEAESALKLRGVLRAGGGARDVRYARIHEEGGTILPVNARALAIPTKFAQTAVGASKYASPRQVPGLRYVWPKGSPRGYLIRDVGGRNARSEIWFILVGRVTMPARPYLAPSRDEAARDIGTRMARAAHRALGLVQ